LYEKDIKSPKKKVKTPRTPLVMRIDDRISPGKRQGILVFSEE
jgi:hypothetical protein